MAQKLLTTWETLFARALAVLDSAAVAGAPAGAWSFGGGTALMRRHRHRLSTDIDIFVADPQVLGYLSPRLNPVAEALTPDYVEQGNFVKLYFAEGEIDFVASVALTRDAMVRETVLGRAVWVETSAEIIAKKIWHRASEIKARDLFDLALVAEREPGALVLIRDVLAARRRVLLQCIDEREDALREDFAALEVLGYRPSFDDCVRAVLDALAIAAGGPFRAEQPRARYRVPRAAARMEIRV